MRLKQGLLGRKSDGSTVSVISSHTGTTDTMRWPMSLCPVGIETQPCELLMAGEDLQCESG